MMDQDGPAHSLARGRLSDRNGRGVTARQARHAGEATTSAESILTFNSHGSNNAFWSDVSWK